jgi:hypothetical protein
VPLSMAAAMAVLDSARSKDDFVVPTSDVVRGCSSLPRVDSADGIDEPKIAVAASAAAVAAAVAAGTTQTVFWDAVPAASVCDRAADVPTLVRHVVAGSARAFASSFALHDAYVLQGDAVASTHLRFGPWTCESCEPIGRAQVRPFVVGSCCVHVTDLCCKGAAGGCVRRARVRSL